MSSYDLTSLPFLAFRKKVQNITDHSSVGGLDDLLGTGGKTDASLFHVRVVGNHSGVVA